jgi:hypothetical protein
MDPLSLYPLPAPLSRASIQAADTLVAIVPASRLQIISEYADLAVAIGLLLILFSVLLFIRKLYQLGRDLEVAAQGYRKDFAPVVDRLRVVTENVEYVSTVVRKDVERLQASVDSLGDKLTQATHEMEDRVQEFNALLGVVQGEAEDLFLDTAATVRGVRAGAMELASGRRPPLPAERDDFTEEDVAAALEEAGPDEDAPAAAPESGDLEPADGSGG